MNKKLQDDVNILDIFRAVASGWKIVVTFTVVGFLASFAYVYVDKKDTVMIVDMYPVLNNANVTLTALYYDALIAQSALDIEENSALVIEENIAKFSSDQVLNILVREILLIANGDVSLSEMPDEERSEWFEVEAVKEESRLPISGLSQADVENSIWSITIKASNREVALRIFDYLVDVASDRTKLYILERAELDRQLIQSNLLFQRSQADLSDEKLLNYYELNREIAEDLGIDTPLSSNILHQDISGIITPNYKDGVAVLNIFIDDILENSSEPGAAPEIYSNNYYLDETTTVDFEGMSFFSAPYPPVFSYSRNDALIIIAAAFLFGLFGSVMALFVHFNRIKSLG